MKLITEQISLSTAEDEHNYFTAAVEPDAPTQVGSAMPTGTYRVVDGSLYLVLASASQELPSTPSRRDSRDE